MHDSCSDAHTPACCCVSALPVVSGILSANCSADENKRSALGGRSSFPVSHPTYIVFCLKADV